MQRVLRKTKNGRVFRPGRQHLTTSQALRDWTLLTRPSPQLVFIAHDLFGKPVSTPHQVRGMLFRIMR